MGCKLAQLPMDPKARLSSFEGTLLDDASLYRKLVGRLLYLTVTWLDIMFVVHKLSQFIAQPRQPHLDAVHHLLKYLKKAPGQGLIFDASSSF